VGYCGADLKALCTEAAMRALRRRYPQIYESTQKLLIKQNDVLVLRKDFADAMRALAPAAHRCVPAFVRARVRAWFLCPCP
jgi:ATPase family AAA domain-containing protein 2